MPNPYHDPDNGQFTTKAGAAGGSSRTGSMNASDAKGQGAENLFGVKATGRMIEDRNGNMVPEYDFSERAKYVDKKLNEWRFHKDADGKPDPIETKSMYSVTVNGKKQYAKWRQKQQQDLMDFMWNKYAKNVPNEGKAYMAGGLGGSGKGTTLKTLGLNPESPDYFTINPDDIKEEMAKRGMIPVLDPKMSLMELSPLAHEEASDIAMWLADKAYAEKKNVVWDFTMATPKSVTEKRLDLMRHAGYTDVKAVFIDVTVETSLKQARGRWQGGMVKYANDGEGLGGRFLPSFATQDNENKNNSHHRSQNKHTFDTVKDQFDGYIVYDNENGSKVVESKNWDRG